MDKQKLNLDLLDFITKSTTSFHSVLEIKKLLLANNFIEIYEQEKWNLKDEGKYFVIRNQSSIIAFIYQKKNELKIIGSHSDFPALKLKQGTLTSSNGYIKTGIDVYGSPILSTWFDRDLSIAGRVNFLSENKIKSILVDFKKPVAFIPNLPIHLTQKKDKEEKINPQVEMNAIISIEKNSSTNKIEKYILKIINKENKIKIDETDILDYELFLYSTEKPIFSGLDEDFISAPRLDNLLSAFISTQALINSDTSSFNLIVVNDHEEAGSLSIAGAQGTFLNSVLKRILPNGEAKEIALSNATMISADNAHALHPNYLDKFDIATSPILDKGVAIKINANQRYATNSNTSALFKYICKKNKLPFQTFITRSDFNSGTTIGPITSGVTGIKTIDIGIPTWAMHSIRETSGTDDPFTMFKIFLEFFSNNYSEILKNKN